MTRRVMRSQLAQWVDPAQAFLAVAGHSPWSIWLDAGPDAPTGLSYISVPAGRVLRARVDTGVVTERSLADGSSVKHESGIFEVLRDVLEHDAAADTSAVREHGFSLGWVGWCGYELAAQTSGVATSVASGDDAVFAEVDWALEFDHGAETLSLIALVADEQQFQNRLAEVLHALAEKTAVVPTASNLAAGGTPQWRHDEQRYRELVQRCLDAITAGDAYQLCLTNEVTVAGRFDPVEVYLRLRTANPSHHGGLLRFGETALLSSSPEVFLRATPEGRIETKPIKGTRRRGATAENDAALAEELVESEKERAENLMIVDLMRNDLGKVAALGSVRVDALLEVESYTNVHQLVSTVSAQLAPGLTAVDALEACFPAGSMTGAPKISAMNLLHEMEQGPRGIYSGVFGYLGIDGRADLAMVIRSIVITASGASVGTGGGITSGSIPQAELEETWVKAAPLLGALGVSSTRYS